MELVVCTVPGNTISYKGTWHNTCAQAYPFVKENETSIIHIQSIRSNRHHTMLSSVDSNSNVCLNIWNPIGIYTGLSSVDSNQTMPSSVDANH